ncbi:uncharacterized protein A4U43_C01F19490 [Asparagus officinalis]|uniref:DNA polymerase delta subunit 3 n=1 Tax=Asparagus officinalis TaxID=4686 RepID=A0A5P1FQM2_ASPOF|nr:uncharacterized protein LOC109825967 [Asparagus officinalis]ONK80586.1 uncharacterized protein A4U43_C01F19490 [Asparagus officinalis]
MAGGEALEISRQIQALVSDKLQVVSYKWLSRNFSLSSNYAKRLLNDFVAEHGNKLQVVYAISGWLKNPQMYCIKLASRSNLAEVKQEFKDNFSVQIYSVQACIPKDLALLWNAEFVQAEELFSQPLTTENCLRDNRYCGVSNSYVKRTVDGKSAGGVSQLKNDGTSMGPKTSSILKNSYAPGPQQAQSSAKNGIEASVMAASSGKSDRSASVINNQQTEPHVTKESIAAINTNKKKGKNETSSGGNGSIASLWGRASGISKVSASATDTTSNVAKISITAEAQICAEEAANAMSSDDDDEADLNYKRGLNGSNNRKRRVVMDFSDEDEEEENVVRLASPDPPNVRPTSTSSHDIGKLEEKKLSSEHPKEEKLEVKQGKTKEKYSGLCEGDLRVGNKHDITGISLHKKSQNNIPNAVDEVTEANNEETNASTLPKRRKVLKTRIDERGREVTEVVWEGEAACDTDKNTTSNDVGSRPPLANKAQEAGRNAPTNPVSKAGNKKPAKGGGKDAKQGNILSFFKKV